MRAWKENLNLVTFTTWPMHVPIMCHVPEAILLICKWFPFEMMASFHKAYMFALFPVNPGRVVSGGICVWYLRHFSSYFRSTQKRGHHTANQQSGTLTNFQTLSADATKNPNGANCRGKWERLIKKASLIFPTSDQIWLDRQAVEQRIEQTNKQSESFFLSRGPL